MLCDILSWGGDFFYLYLSDWGGDPNSAEIQFFLGRGGGGVGVFWMHFFWKFWDPHTIPPPTHHTHWDYPPPPPPTGIEVYGQGFGGGG